MITGPDGFPKNYGWLQLILASFLFYILFQMAIIKNDWPMFFVAGVVLIIIVAVLVQRAIYIKANLSWKIVVVLMADIILLFLSEMISGVFYLFKAILIAIVLFKLVNTFFLRV